MYTTEQQDRYFHEGCCPNCGSAEVLVSRWQDVKPFRTRLRIIFCNTCEEGCREIHVRDSRTRFLEGRGES